MQKYLEHAKLLVDRIELLRRIGHKEVTCEVGVASGDFSQQILEHCTPSKHYLIDSWSVPGRYDHLVFKSVIRRFMHELDSGRVDILRQNSVDGLKQLPDSSVDFLYIDTDHSYQTTVRELAIAAAKVKPDGIIAGHDYMAHGRYDKQRKVLIPYGVVEAVQEFIVSAQYNLLYLTCESHGALSFALQKA